ncbi:oxygenase MpaB family protein [Novosphingobium mangrovi (ex Huang et al. 2023)]|uniref:Oxygenase MpaB family protein n=1 Tax=Novosphingobium mangrovi (ex Huang et al. 2023) TaxID=2976432 RepID=A0ABT2I0Z9_9SPHN|nr:oxygenase MpaB family protein [Novosphingobium mangrovi (ex Huang et al. 2023)]MCT2398477.1 oxygenase MpaB family protein [Novosphingobium mangrovi (ex Huang et al. 2023)]
MAVRSPSDMLRGRLVRQVQAVFNDRSKGETPVVRSSNALFAPGSVIWRVHGDVTTMMIGGIAALLLQMLHPAALAGVWDHSAFRDDMLGRLRRTARFIAVTTFADRDQAMALIERVNTIHGAVHGTLPDGTPYSARDPELLAWVHTCEAYCFLEAWKRFGEGGMAREDQDTYFRQAAVIARMLGADPAPDCRSGAICQILNGCKDLVADERTRAVAERIVNQKSTHPALAPVQKALVLAAIDMLPDWARAMHGLELRSVTALAANASARVLAGTLRWGFAQRQVPAPPVSPMRLVG